MKESNSIRIVLCIPSYCFFLLKAWSAFIVPWGFSKSRLLEEVVFEGSGWVRGMSSPLCCQSSSQILRSIPFHNFAPRRSPPSCTRGALLVGRRRGGWLRGLGTTAPVLFPLSPLCIISYIIWGLRHVGLASIGCPEQSKNWVFKVWRDHKTPWHSEDFGIVNICQISGCME